MRLLLTTLSLAGVVIASIPASHAMIIRHDVADTDYVVADADYPALVDLFGPGDCIGTLIHESYLLTVAHCAMDLQAGQSLPVNGVDHAIAEVILHPSWEDVDNYDIALIRFAEPVAGVEPLPIYRGPSELGAVVTLVGRGVTATGLVGEEGADDDGKLRAVTNIVSGVDDHFIEIRFERDPEDQLTPLEGVGAAGDSGCPVFIEVEGVRAIAGLNSFGEGAAGVGAYGARDYQSRVSSYLEWLDSVVPAVGSTDDPGIDDPETDDRGDADGAAGCAAGGAGGGPGALFLLGLLLAARRRTAP